MTSAQQPGGADEHTCMIRVLSLYDSSARESSSAMASSNAVLASLQARSARIRRYHHVLESGKQNLRQDSGIPNKLTWRVEDLIVKYRVVEGETQADRMCGGKFLGGNL